MPANIGNIFSSEKWKKIRFRGSIAILILDFVSDLNANIIYWRNKDESPTGLGIAIFATISLVLGFLILSITVFETYIEDAEYENENRRSTRFIEAIVESIPQLWISLYVLSVSDDQELRERIYLYASAAISFLTVVSILFEIDKVMKGENIVPKPFALKALQFTWESTSFFVRMTALVYISVELDRWTALFIGFHLICFVVFDYITNVFGDHEIELSLPRRILAAGVFVFFVIDFNATPNQIAALFILHTTQNVFAILLTILLWADKPFYLFSNFLVVNMSVHIISLVSSAIYYVIMERNPDYSRSQDKNSGGGVGMSLIAATDI